MRQLRIEGLGRTPLVFSESLVTLGRSPSNMVVIRNPRVSSVHGEIVQRSQQFYYRDLGSTNGSLLLREGQETLVDGRGVREVKLLDGDRIVLGDRRDPTVIQVFMGTEADRPDHPEGVVCHKELTTIAQLGTQVLDNPLTKRQTLHQLLAFFSELALTRNEQSLTRLLSEFLLDLIAKNIFVAIYLRKGPTVERIALVSRKPGATPVISSEELSTWFPDAFLGNAAMVVLLPPARRPRISGAEHLAAVPLPAESGSLGAAIVGRSVAFTDFDLDLLTLVAHHAALQLQRIALIQRLARTNLDLSRENRALHENLGEATGEPTIVGVSRQLDHVLEQARRVAQTDTTVLLLGETGTGKELIAHAIHHHSSRRDACFAPINCAALTETLLESELFGHVKGAFTGAETDHKGLFVAADTGTLFLDEIGDISPRLQVRLLRVLESSEITPVGAETVVPIDVRIIAATNKDLQAEVEQGRFREDLYYRINVFPIRVPPLRERVEDIPLLVDHFLDRFCARVGREKPPLSPAVRQALGSYDWPGNVRELQNEIERLVVLADPQGSVGEHLLSDRIAGVHPDGSDVGLLKALVEKFEERTIRRILSEHQDNRTRTAKALGISRQALNEKLKKYGIGRKRQRRNREDTG